MQKQGPYRRRFAAVLLSAVLSLAHPVLPLITAATLITTEDAEARRSSSSSSSRSSGGYSRPSSSSSSRTPSYSSGSSSSSGGYSRPGSSSTTTTRTPSLSASDRDIARSSSGTSLQSYRSSRTPDATPSAPISSGNSYSIPRRDNAPAYSYAPPRYTYGSPGRFGIWDAAMLWFMLDSLSNSSRSSFFYNHANDPGVQQWRAEADKLATENADLKAKLGQLDTQVAAQSGQPRDENYLPPDIGMPAEPEEDGDSGWLILLGLAGFAGWIIYKRIGARKAANQNAGAAMPLGPLKPAVDILKRKFGSEEAYRPDWFRVGMPLQIDPSPFLLLGPDTALRTPPARTDVEAVSTLVGTSATIYRLYLSGTEGAFVEVSLDKSGQPSGARYFAPLDEVHPADDGEWDFWLNDDEGMIGWHEFQAKDGKTYGRMWAQGGDRVDPIGFTETRERVDGTGQRDLKAMLYGRETGLKAPAPTAEYLLVAATDTGSEAWVELFTGIDINPASLGLA